MRFHRHNLMCLASVCTSIGLIGLAGCVQDRIVQPPRTVIETKPKVVVKTFDVTAICEKNKAYVDIGGKPTEEAVALANAIAALPKDSPLVTAMGDYKRMRDDAAKCAAAAAEKNSVKPAQ